MLSDKRGAVAMSLPCFIRVASRDLETRKLKYHFRQVTPQKNCRHSQKNGPRLRATAAPNPAMFNEMNGSEDNRYQGSYMNR